MDYFADPEKLAIVLAVFSALISMFACLYVWISDNRQYLQAETINKALRRMEQRVESFGVRDKYIEELYELLSLQQDLKTVEEGEACKTRLYLMFVFDHLYRAYSDWRDQLFDDEAFFRLTVQNITLLMSEPFQDTDAKAMWQEELSPGFSDPVFQNYIAKALEIGDLQGKEPAAAASILSSPDRLWAHLFRKDVDEEQVTDESGTDDEDIVALVAHQEKTRQTARQSPLSWLELKTAVNGWHNV